MNSISFPIPRWSFCRLDFCACFILFLLGNLGSIAADKPMNITNALHTSGITVVDISSPSFNDEVQSLLSPKALSKAASFLPYSVIIVNNTGRYIWGFTVVYSYPEWMSASGKPWTHRISPSVNGPVTDRQLMLSPGGAILVTPISGFLAARQTDGTRTLQPPTDDGLDPIIEQFQARLGRSNRNIEVMIDSVVFEDGLLLGPDTQGMVEKINSRIKADSDVGLSLRGLRNKELRSELSHAQMGVRGEHVNGEYSDRVSSRGKIILQLLDQHGEAAALDFVEKLRITKWFTNSDRVRRGEQ